jgi:5'-nucleotidase
VAEMIDPRGRPFYWIEEGESAWEADERSDYHAVRAGWISITPLHPDLTRHDALTYAENLPLSTEVAVD